MVPLAFSASSCMRVAPAVSPISRLHGGQVRVGDHQHAAVVDAAADGLFDQVGAVLRQGDGLLAIAGVQ